MRYSEKYVTDSHRKILDAATRLFGERGYSGISIADLMKEAGLTHGGFYGHFKSKEELLGKACARALSNATEEWRELSIRAEPNEALEKIRSTYLSSQCREILGRGCTLTSYGADLARLTGDTRKEIEPALLNQIGFLSELHHRASDGRSGRSEAIVEYATMIGALLLSRVIDDADVSTEIIDTVVAALNRNRDK